MEAAEKYYSKLYQWFADIPKREIDKILIREIEQDSIFVMKDRVFQNIYIVLDGICNVINRLDNGNEIITLKLTQGDLIGVSESILNCIKHIASVKACTPLIVAEMDDPTFQSWMDKYPSFTRFVLKNIIIRLHYTADFSANCQTSNSKINLAKYLIDRYTVELTSYPANYSGSVRIHETHEMISNFLGISPRTVDRQVHALKGQGLISTKKGKIHISASQYQNLLCLVLSNL